MARLRPIPHLRWYVAGLLCLVTQLNYLDRQTLSVLAHTIQGELGLSTVQYSYITTSFLVSYTVMYAVSGRLVDWLGTRRSFIVFVSVRREHAARACAIRASVRRFPLPSGSRGTR